jgi:hypothetical protein
MLQRLSQQIVCPVTIGIYLIILYVFGEVLNKLPNIKKKLHVVYENTSPIIPIEQWLQKPK